MRPVMLEQTVLGNDVLLGDLIAVGGIRHQVTNIRQVRGLRRCLEFSDGNVYVVGNTTAIAVSRAAVPPGRRIPRSPLFR
ncbi:hypothetical protein [Streptomyces sp. NPDC059991]|uniref:hypothetical protein n=1 Tax=unclassified Streptomyces TaxID=2593676 RepID=UPI0036B1A7FE